MSTARRLPDRRTIAMVVVALGGCTGSEPAGYETPRGADRAIVRLITEITAEGRRALRVEADSAFFGTDSDVVTLVNLRGSMFGPNGLAAVTIQADSGTLETATQRLTALGEVLARTREGNVSIRTTTLTFDASSNRIASDAATTVEARGGTQSGSCFEGDLLLTEWSLCSGT